MCRPLTDWPHNGLGDAVHSAPSLSTALMRRSGLCGLSECRRTCVRTRAGSHAVMDRGAAGEAPFCLRASGGGAGRRGGPHATRSAPPSIALKHRSRGWKNVRGDAFDRPFPFGGAPCAAAGLEGLRPRPRSTLLQGGSSVQKRERALRLGAATLVARQHGEHRSCFLEPPPNRGRGKSSIARSSPVHPLLNRWFTQSIHSIEASPDGSTGRQFRVRGGGWRAAAHFSSARAGQCGAAATRAGFFLP